MPEAVVETKLRLPRLRQQTVPRPRLEELLHRGTGTTLTLVAAPAGFGKTTLLGTWLARRAGECPVAWVSLDERDADPGAFWSHVLLAVERAVPGAATAALVQLETGRTPIEDVLTVLVNELGVIAADVSLVLDDYHLAESPAVQPGMSFLLEHLPPQVHLVISTRSDPALPLPRLRVRGELVEIRAADLRFTDDEATAYLNDINGLALDATDVSALESRTEGWAAALQLAALSLQGKEEPGAFISGFAGDDRFVVDYLADEVLDRQPPDVRAFLLDTAVLDELTAPLCDAVTGRTDGRAMLELLDRANLFVVPLDDRRGRYRYHHLFADVLRAHLRDERPDDVPALHRRASDWYQRAGEPEAAVRHARATGDLGLVAERIEVAVPVLLRERREGVLRRWARDLPADIVRDRPVLAVGLVGALMSSNDFDGVQERLDEAEAMLSAPAGGLVIVDEAEAVRLPAAIQTYRAALALVGGRPEATVEHARRALSLASDDDHLSIAAASALLGLASWTGGELDAAHQAYRTAADHLARAGHVADVLGCSIILADLELTGGRLRDARRTFEHALNLAADDRMRGVPDMYVGLSRVAWEQGDVTAARDFLSKADEAGDARGLPQNPYRWRAMLARLRYAEGDTATALGLLADAERVYVGDFAPDVQPVAATRARILAASGDVAGARQWAAGRGVSAGDELTYLSEYDHLTLARVLLAEHAARHDDAALAEASTLLRGIAASVRKGGRTGTLIETLVLQAVAALRAADCDAATRSLEEALRLAEPEGFVRVFTDEGAALHELLTEFLVHDPERSFVRRLLHVGAPGRPSTDGGGPAPAASARGPVEPLSSREIDVLRLLGSELSGPEIARRLHVSLATVRTHTQHVYAKLGVNNRGAAVRRAHQLDLFPRAGH